MLDHSTDIFRVTACIRIVAAKPIPPNHCQSRVVIKGNAHGEVFQGDVFQGGDADPLERFGVLDDVELEKSSDKEMDGLNVPLTVTIGLTAVNSFCRPGAAK